MSVTDHYASLLARVYAWMSGDTSARVEAFRHTLASFDLANGAGRTAVDLGCGHGIQSLALAACGYAVTSVDTSEPLLADLAAVAPATVSTVQADLRTWPRTSDTSADVVVCWGDTIAHLDSMSEVRALLRDVRGMLAPGGCFVVSFRDTTQLPDGTSRFIPVRSDESRIMMCVIEADGDHVRVTDIVHDRTPDGWTHNVSSYRKVRLTPQDVEDALLEAGFVLDVQTVIDRQVAMVARLREGGDQSSGMTAMNAS